MIKSSLTRFVWTTFSSGSSTLTWSDWKKIAKANWTQFHYEETPLIPDLIEAVIQQPLSLGGVSRFCVWQWFRVTIILLWYTHIIITHTHTHLHPHHHTHTHTHTHTQTHTHTHTHTHSHTHAQKCLHVEKCLKRFCIVLRINTHRTQCAWPILGLRMQNFGLSFAETLRLYQNSAAAWSLWTLSRCVRMQEDANFSTITVKCFQGLVTHSDSSSSDVWYLHADH